MFCNDSYTLLAIDPPTQLVPILNSTVIQSLLSRIYTYCYTTSLDYWFSNWQTHLALTPLLLENPQTKVCFTHFKGGYTQAFIENLIEKEALPKELTYEKPWGESSSANPTIRFIHVNKGMELFKYFDKECKGKLKEAKHLSLGLQTDKNHRVRVYTNLLENTYTIITSKYDWELLRRVIALMPKLFPKDFKISSDIEKILKAYGKSEYDTWVSLLNEYFDKQDILTAQLKQDIQDLLQAKKAANIRAKERAISDTNSQIKQFTMSLESYYRNLAILQEELFIMEQIPENDTEDLYDYLKRNKYIKNIIIKQPYLFFSIVCPISFYDVNALKAYYKHNHSKITAYPNAATIFKACLINNKFQIYTETPIRINFKDLTFTIDTTYAMQDTIYQPHLVHYDCWGGNKPLITKALTQGDVIGAIEQMIAATKNINFLDSIVIEHFAGTINNFTRSSTSSIKFFFDPETNTFYNAYEILQKIKESEDFETDKDIGESEEILIG